MRVYNRNWLTGLIGIISLIDGHFEDGHFTIRSDQEKIAVSL